jgi:hypothetical protein
MGGLSWIPDNRLDNSNQKNHKETKESHPVPKSLAPPSSVSGPCRLNKMAPAETLREDNQAAHTRESWQPVSQPPVD